MNQFLDEFKRLLLDLRQTPPHDSVGFSMASRRAWGYLAALHEIQLLSFSEYERLRELIYSASKNCSRVPFPDARNAGPLIPYHIAIERSRSVEAVPHVPAKVPVPAPHTGLRLLCLLVTSRTGETRSLPVHTMRPMPPAVLRLGRWSLASDPAFVLRETQAIRPTAEVLERCSRRRQTHAVRANSRAVRTEGVMV